MGGRTFQSGPSHLDVRMPTLRATSFSLYVSVSDVSTEQSEFVFTFLFLSWSQRAIERSREREREIERREKKGLPDGWMIHINPTLAAHRRTHREILPSLLPTMEGGGIMARVWKWHQLHTWWKQEVIHILRTKIPVLVWRNREKMFFENTHA